MKKLLSVILVVIAIIFCSGNASAQQRTEIVQGIYITTYGNISVIENDNTQQTVQIKVVKSDSLYDIMCGNTIVKTVAKAGLREGITYVIQGYTAIPNWLTRAGVGYVVDKVYDGVCESLGS